MNDSFSTPVKDISQDLSIIEQDERPTYRRSKKLKDYMEKRIEMLIIGINYPMKIYYKNLLKYHKNQVNTIIPKGNLQLLTKPNRKFIII